MKRLGFARRLVACLITGGVALGVAAPAQAGTYEVHGCRDTTTGLPLGPTSPSGWTMVESPDENNFFSTADCASTGGRLQIYPDNTGGSMGATRRGDLAFNAPAGTILRAYEIYRAMRINGSDPFVYGAYVGGIGWRERCFAAFASCQAGDLGSPLSAANRLQGTIGGEGGQGLALQLYCDGSCPKSASAANISIYASKMTLEENDRPTFASPPSGSLLADGEVSGTRMLNFVGADVGSGVHKVTVTSSARPDVPLASKTIDSGNGRCDTPKFTYVVPCPLSIDDSVEVDTLQFPDGPQTITVTLADAAGNTRSVTNDITVENAPESTAPPSVGFNGTIKAGDELTCDPGTFTPAPERIDYQWLVGGVLVEGATASKFTVRTADVGKSIVCRVTAVRGGGSTTSTSSPVGGPGQPGGPAGTTTNPPGGGAATPSSSNSTTTNGISNSSNTTTNSTSTAIDNPANANGSGGLVVSARFTAASKKTRRIRYGQKVTLTGQLRDADGRPIRNATVDVFSAIARKGAVRRQLGTVTTDADGVYRWVTPVGVSRNIRFAYRSTFGAAQYSDVADVALRVRGKLTIRALSGKVRSFGVMRLRGKLFGSGLPRRGALIEIQYLDGTTWKVAAVRRAKGGKLRFDYRFKRTSKGSFVFRARMRNQAGVPLLATASKKVKIKVG